MSPIKGRVAHIVKVHDKEVFPIDVEEIIANISGLGDEYQIIVDRPTELDRLKAKVEYRPEVKDVKALQNQVEGMLSQGLNIESEVELVPMGTILRTVVGRAPRVIKTY